MLVGFSLAASYSSLDLKIGKSQRGVGTLSEVRLASSNAPRRWSMLLHLTKILAISFTKAAMRKFVPARTKLEFAEVEGRSSITVYYSVESHTISA